MLNQLTYSIKENHSKALNLKYYIDLIAQLALLRDHSGPVVSYMKAATFNPESLTEARKEEIKMRRQWVRTLINSLRLMGESSLPDKTMVAIEKFEQFYNNQVLSTAEEIASNPQFIDKITDNYSYYLKDGVKALEQLKSITDDIVNISKNQFHQQWQESIIKIVVSVVISLFVPVILIKY